MNPIPIDIPSQKQLPVEPVHDAKILKPALFSYIITGDETSIPQGTIFDNRESLF
jgi:hypothetical protein